MRIRRFIRALLAIGLAIYMSRCRRASAKRYDFEISGDLFDLNTIFSSKMLLADDFVSSARELS